MDKKYRVVFLGLVDNDEGFQERMYRLGVPLQTVEQMISSAPIVLKGGLSLGAAREYADAVQHAGGRVNIQEYGIMEEARRLAKPLDVKSLQAFAMCPQCGHKQLKAPVCSKCGKIFGPGEAGDGSGKRMRRGSYKI